MDYKSQQWKPQAKDTKGFTSSLEVYRSFMIKFWDLWKDRELATCVKHQFNNDRSKLLQIRNSIVSAIFCVFLILNQIIFQVEKIKIKNNIIINMAEN